MLESRRNFLKSLSLGTAGLTIGSHSLAKKANAAQSKPGKSIVSFVPGNDRREMIYQTLKPFEKEIKEGIQGKQIVIKPNCVWHDNPLCATHPDAIRGVLDFLKPLYDKTVFIGESTASPKGSMFCFEQYGYFPLEKEFNVKLIDLNLDSYTTEWILNAKNHPLDVKIIDTFLNQNNYIISLARMKTHDCVVCTLSLKNVVLAAPLNVSNNHPDFIRNQNEKAKMHEGDFNGINYNMFLIAHKVRPRLSIIDGFVGMEGNGPNRGTPVEHGVAVASFDVISADRIGSDLMGINYRDIGYLQWCSAAGLGHGERSDIDIIGPDISHYTINYKLHDNIERQLEWKEKS